MSMRSGSASPTSPTASSPMATASPFDLFPAGSGETILFESYLYKTPPLKSFIMKWSKRWFVLSTVDPMDPSSIQLSYYKDESKKEVRKVIDLSKFVGIRPSAKVGNHQHVFAIETEERKYILKAQDLETKNIWLAKLCELFGQEQVCHVTIPQQPSCAYTEAILKLTCPSHVIAIAPSTGSTLVEIPFEEVRRIGTMDAYGTDIIWFETCKHTVADNFVFFTVPSGREIAKSVVRELKTAIECYTSVLLIMEDSNEQEVSFISKDHYGCPEFPAISRSAILQSGLRQLPACWQTYIMQERLRRESEPSPQPRRSSCDHGATGAMSLDEWSAARSRKKAASMKGPPSLTRRPTLDKFIRQASVTSFERDHSSPLLELSAGHFSHDSQNEVFSPPPIDSTPPPPALHNSPRQRPSLSHQSSSSSLTTSTPSPPSHRQRKLSCQSSISSHSSTNSFPPQATIQERSSAHNSVSSLELEDSTNEPSFSYVSSAGPDAPVVPPRSVVSLRDAYAYSRHLTAAH